MEKPIRYDDGSGIVRLWLPRGPHATTGSATPYLEGRRDATHGIVVSMEAYLRRHFLLQRPRA
jgi:hypothetical protein